MLNFLAPKCLLTQVCPPYESNQLAWIVPLPAPPSTPPSPIPYWPSFPAVQRSAPAVWSRPESLVSASRRQRAQPPPGDWTRRNTPTPRTSPGRWRYAPSTWRLYPAGTDVHISKTPPRPALHQADEDTPHRLDVYTLQEPTDTSVKHPHAPHFTRPMKIRPIDLTSIPCRSRRTHQ